MYDSLQHDRNRAVDQVKAIILGEFQGKTQYDFARSIMSGFGYDEFIRGLKWYLTTDRIMGMDPFGWQFQVETDLAYRPDSDIESVLDEPNTRSREVFVFLAWAFDGYGYASQVVSGAGPLPMFGDSRWSKVDPAYYPDDNLYYPLPEHLEQAA